MIYDKMQENIFLTLDSNIKRSDAYYFTFTLYDDILKKNWFFEARYSTIRKMYEKFGKKSKKYLFIFRFPSKSYFIKNLNPKFLNSRYEAMC